MRHFFLTIECIPNSCWSFSLPCLVSSIQAALKQLPKNKVPNMAVMIKSLMRTNVDAGAEFKDPTGKGKKS